MSTLGKNLRILRKRNRMSQIDLASIIGITERTIYNYETGLKVPKQSVLDMLADALSVNPELLENGNPDTDFMTMEQYDQMKKSSPSSKEFLKNAAINFGNAGVLEAAELLDQTAALFAGGALSEEAKDEFFESITQAYFLAKRKSKLLSGGKTGDNKSE